ncbi:hypothetical protein [uncultured Mediterranean phage uvMED]|nr:hypothetical protein [uncultured Mediterranean phage uvMED]
MGLDQYAGSREWRKHARLQQFMSVMHKEQNPKIEYDSSGIPSLGFNGGDKPVDLTEDVVQKLEEAVNNGFMNYFCPDGFFWGQQFQEESVKEYKEQDLEFVAECKQALKDGQILTYECSW